MVKAVPVSRLRATFLCNVVARRLCLTLLLLSACDGVSRSDDTLGLQSYGRWEWHGRILAEADPKVTIARLRMDTSQGGGDVVLARYDFNPAVGEGDEYSLTLGLELGRAHDLVPGKPYAFGAGPGQIAAHSTVACLCRPLRPDSVGGTYLLATRGLRQLTGRVDATLYFTEWNDPARHVTYSLHQRIDAIK